MPRIEIVKCRGDIGGNEKPPTNPEGARGHPKNQYFLNNYILKNKRKMLIINIISSLAKITNNFFFDYFLTPTYI
jgi:hypothetical protein